MKKKMFRRALALFVSLGMLLTLVLPAFAANIPEGATSFVFSNDGIDVTKGDYDGYKVQGTALSVTDAGVYVLSGACENGTVVVKKGVTGVTLILNGLTLSASATAPLTCNKGSEAEIVAAAGTVNTLADDALNNDETNTDTENYPDVENAVIKCKDGSKVTLCGTGTLNVLSKGKNGVKGGADLYDDEGRLESEASLTIRDLTLNVTAEVNDGVKADKELNLLSGTVTVRAADDGVKSDLTLNIGEKGTPGPVIRVEESYEGIEAATINMYSGDVTVVAEEDGVNAANSDLTGYAFSLNVYGGKLKVDAKTGDGLDSNGALNLMGGEIEVFSSQNGDNAPLDSETGFTLGSASVFAVGAGNMAETPKTASVPWVAFGGGMGMGGGTGRPGGQGGFDPGQEGERPTPPGGVSGGDRPTPPGGQGGFDPGQGGVPGAQITIGAGDTVSVTDENGDVLYSAVSPRNASYVFFASALLTEGKTYRLLVNGEEVASAAASTVGGMGPGGPGGEPGGFLSGDVDFDGEITAADARLALRAAVKLEDFAPGGPEYRAADVDNDRVLTAADARVILRRAVGLSDN